MHGRQSRVGAVVKVVTGRSEVRPTGASDRSTRSATRTGQRIRPHRLTPRGSGSRCRRRGSPVAAPQSQTVDPGAGRRPGTTAPGHVWKRVIELRFIDEGVGRSARSAPASGDITAQVVERQHHAANPRVLLGKPPQKVRCARREVRSEPQSSSPNRSHGRAAVSMAMLQAAPRHRHAWADAGSVPRPDAGGSRSGRAPSRCGRWSRRRRRRSHRVRHPVERAGCPVPR